MTSTVDICNLALSGIRAKSINSLVESSREAQQCTLWYSIVRDMVQRDTNWGFAHQTDALALRTEDPLEWVYAYQYPSDALKVHYVTADFGFKPQSATDLALRQRHDLQFVEPLKELPYEVSHIDGNQVILTDQPEAYVVYTKRIDDPNLFPPDLIMAMSHYLGAMIAIPLIGGDLGRAMRQEALQLYAALINTAAANNGNQQKRPIVEDNAFINARTT